MKLSFVEKYGVIARLEYYQDHRVQLQWCLYEAGGREFDIVYFW